MIKTVIYCDEGKRVGKKTRRVIKIGSRKGGGKKKKEVGPIEEGKSKIIGLRTRALI